MHAKINVAFSQQLLVQKRPVLYQNGAKIDMFLGYFNMSSENGSKGLKTGGLGRSVGAPSHDKVMLTAISIRFSLVEEGNQGYGASHVTPKIQFIGLRIRGHMTLLAGLH